MAHLKANNYSFSAETESLKYLYEVFIFHYLCFLSCPSFIILFDIFLPEAAV
jgi:hypothetical protein